MIRTQQLLFQNGAWTSLSTAHPADAAAVQLILAFGDRDLLGSPQLLTELQERFPLARVVRTSTAGEIAGDRVNDGTIVATALHFERTTLHFALENIRDHMNSRDLGAALMRALPTVELAGVLVFSDGGRVNGSELARGLDRENTGRVPVTGGLAGDGARFERTLCGLDDRLEEGQVVAIGLTGEHLHVGHGSFGGWDEFGPERMVTYSEANVLHKIDGRSALSLYKEYLGPYAKELPGSALLFPLSMRVDGSPTKLVRTILSVNEENDTMTFAGDIPYGSHVRLMKANFDKLVDASTTAARNCFHRMGETTPDLALLISCVGRKLVLQERVEEEVEAAHNVFGPATCVTGFYSYGELSPLNPDATCNLHNQTMTITTLTES